MVVIELVGGPRCGDKLHLRDDFLPEHHTVEVVSNRGAVTERHAFKYERNLLLPRESKAAAYEFMGYGRGHEIRA